MQNSNIKTSNVDLLNEEEELKPLKLVRQNAMTPIESDSNTESYAEYVQAAATQFTAKIFFRRS